ncbi:Aminomethyltransferase folate-binding domain-containing protein [Dothidotthia symphoricarpi CBS 119687]|uniref:Iron-sulfur cluster assembly factor IBA57 homolog, mitochondrial n=1 Tax=Dothidotthia symphoricarpi CBS 119687 TaxID=1392245 RepID=A0A6A6A5V9_9PLEO|nr:Aminomethyltransferase folate-binding domain-containing protein [Dothidotthia symphoricarpi CBS 119687]KAF2126474.1 Aminomethyltransferase folate-binding domain-containing protein [Dothidotthia symphoricarpi CBS 119687]
MASLLSSNPLRTRIFVCDTCRSSLRLERNARSAVPRTLTTASWQSRQYRRNQPNYLPTLRFSPRPYHEQRTYSSATRPTNSGTTPLPQRRLLSLSGPDAAKFLQGLITNNVDPQHPSPTPFYSAFLDARGRVLWDVFIWVYPELVAEKGAWACYIEVDAEEAASLKKHLKRHKLRSKINIEDAEGLMVWAAWGDMCEKMDNEGVVVSMHDPRGPGLWRGLVKDNMTTLGERDVVDEVQYRIKRYQLGIPEGPLEIPRETALPMEHNIDLSSGIDFKKGCYVGQELTIRTKHTGVVRKRVLPVTLYTMSSTTETSISPEQDVDLSFNADFPELPPGADIKPLDSAGQPKKGRACGKFIAGVGNVGLALCRLEIMTPMKISAEGGSWKPGTKFGVSLGTQVEDGEERGGGDEIAGVRATLHDWFLVKERDLWDKNRTRI